MTLDRSISPRCNDRRQAFRMVVEGAAIGLAATLLVVVIPV